MTNEDYYNIFDQMIEDLQDDNRDRLTKVISSIMNLSMRIEQEKAVKATPYEKRLRTSRLAERPMKEIKRRTKVAMTFPNKDSVNRACPRTRL